MPSPGAVARACFPVKATPPAEFWSHCTAALRPALACLTGMLVFQVSNQDFFDVGFIGPLGALVIAGTPPCFGAALGMVKGMLAPLLLATALGSGLTSGLSRVDPQAYQVAFPFLTAFVAFMFRMLFGAGGLPFMIFYIDFSGPVRYPQDPPDDWASMNLLLEAICGVGIGLVFQLLPLPFTLPRNPTPLPASAALVAGPLCDKARGLTKQILQLLVEGALADSTDFSTLPADLLLEELSGLLEKLKKLQPVAAAELRLLCRKDAAADLEHWVKLLQLQYQKLQVMRFVLDGPALGDHQGFVTAMARPFLELADGLGQALQSEAPAAPAVARLPMLREACMTAFDRARGCLLAEHAPGEGDSHLVSRSAFTAALIKFPSWDVAPPAKPVPKRPLSERLQGWAKSRPALLPSSLKYALTMFIASLWVAVDWLWDRSAEHGDWVGITANTVTLATAGLSLIKLRNRLTATMLACTLGIFVDNVSGSGNTNVWYAILVLVLFVFMCYVVRQSIEVKYGYAAQCAATTAVLVLYEGAGERDVDGFVIARVAMIMYGCLIYLGVEMLIFPVSPRTELQEEALSFLPLLDHAVGSLAAVVDAYPHAPVDALKAELGKLLAACVAASGKAQRLLPEAAAEPNIGLRPPFAAKEVAALVKAQDYSVSALKFLGSGLTAALDFIAAHGPALSPADQDLLALAAGLLRRAAAHVSWCTQHLMDLLLALGSATPWAHATLSQLLAPFRQSAALQTAIVKEGARYAADAWRRGTRLGTEAHPELLLPLGTVVVALQGLARGMQRIGSALEQLVLWYFTKGGGVQSHLWRAVVARRAAQLPPSLHDPTPGAWYRPPPVPRPAPTPTPYMQYPTFPGDASPVPDTRSLPPYRASDFQSPPAYFR